MTVAAVVECSYVYQRRAKYVVQFPGGAVVYCATMDHVARVLRHNGRRFTKSDVVTLLDRDPSRNPKRVCRKRLDGAEVSRL